MRYISAFLLALLLASCKNGEHRVNEITKVELARSGAWTDFGAVISIDSSLNYNYHGKYGNIKKGYFTGKVSPDFWDTLNQKFEQVHYKKIKPIIDSMNVVDVNYFELIIHWKNQKLRIIRVRPRETDSLMNVIFWLDSSYTQIKLRQARSPFKFETTYQDPPHPQIKQVKFPPPIKNNHKAK